MDVNTSVTSVGQKNGEKYSLRPRVTHRIKRGIEQDGKGNISRQTNAVSNIKFNKLNDKDNVKQKPASLSKYRRKTANARERSRMREINSAFETLRKAVPSYMPQLIFPGDGSNEKLTKITTLRLAMKYITRLTELLDRDNRSYNAIDDYNETVECHPIIFRDTADTCTLTALNTSSYDLLNSPNYITDGGSDGESLHSGATLETIIESSIETLVPDVNFEFSDHFFNSVLS